MKFSILCAAHNEELHIGEMLDSALAQTHELWELIVVDDRSSDRTGEIVGRYAHQDSRIRRADSLGVSGKNSAWNRAYELATGEVIIYQGADDILPPDALQARYAALQGADATTERIAVFSKVRMFSEDPRFDGVVVPRGESGSRSGGTTAMTRAMADLVFPMDTTLPNEDLWTSTLVEFMSHRQIDLPVVTVNYRIHAGNSFRRDQDFQAANDALHQRGTVYLSLLGCERLELPVTARTEISYRATLEEWRHQGRTLRLLGAAGVSLRHRLRLASQSSRLLYLVRQRFYRVFSGW